MGNLIKKHVFLTKWKLVLQKQWRFSKASASLVLALVKELHFKNSHLMRAKENQDLKPSKMFQNHTTFFQVESKFSKQLSSLFLVVQVVFQGFKTVQLDTFIFYIPFQQLFSLGKVQRPPHAFRGAREGTGILSLGQEKGGIISWHCQNLWSCSLTTCCPAYVCL